MGKKSGETLGKHSQEAQLRKLVRQALTAVGIGVVFLILFMVANYLLSTAQTGQLSATMALNQYRLGSKNLTTAVQAYSVTGEQEHYDEYMKELNEDQNREKALEILRERDIKDDEWAGLNQIAELSNGLVPLEEEAMAAAASGDTKTAQECVFGEEYEQKVEEINRLTEETILKIQERKNQQASMLRVIQIVLEILFMISFVYVVMQIVKSIKFSQKELLRPIKKVSKEMEALAQGDFSVDMGMEADDSEVGKMVESIAFMRQNLLNMIGEISKVLDAMGNGNYQIKIEQEYVGEFVQIKESFIKIGEKMRETLMTIREVSGQIDRGSEQLACAAEDLAEGSTTQASQVSDLVSVIEDMSKSMENNAVKADESVKMAAKAGETILIGNEKMQELKDAIGEISQCSEQIGTIISDIEDIASQTNLLSLNASIEAARAGEAGKGFAVVAEQVKNLAEESTKAAGRTTELIEKTISKVEKGMEIADATAANMEEVMVGAREATEKMSEIAHMLSEDVEHMHHVNESITVVSSVVDNNSATSEETAAVSEEQRAQVETMVNLMDKFQI